MDATLAVIIGAVIGATGSMITTHLHNRHQEKNRIRELVFQAGIENFKQACEMARKNQGKVPPMEDFVLYWFAVQQEISQLGTITTSNLSEALEKTKNIAVTLSNFRFPSKENGSEEK